MDMRNPLDSKPYRTKYNGSPYARHGEEGPLVYSLYQAANVARSTLHTIDQRLSVLDDTNTAIAVYGIRGRIDC